MIFTTKEELILQAQKDGACEEGIKFATSCKSLYEIFETIDKYMRLWCLRKGYEQFADHCDFEKLDGDAWSRLLRYQPQFADHCDWLKLDSLDWSTLLSRQPQFASYRK